MALLFVNLVETKIIAVPNSCRGTVYLLLFSVALLFGCKKEEVTFTDNDIPEYSGVPTVLVQNYVNRLFIDLIGREPLDTEMDAEVIFLEENELSVNARTTLVNKLMFNTNYLPGDSSYNYAYFTRLYDNAKARMIQGASDAVIMQQYGIFNNAAINDSLGGNLTGYELNRQQADRLLAIVNSREELRNEEIEIDEMFRRLIFNSIYDQINMNSFNFVNASFDDLFYRFPTQAEFDNAYDVIEFNQPAVIFGEVVQNKTEYLNVLTASPEYSEGMVIWAYNSLLARDPSSQEVFVAAGNFGSTMNFQSIQRGILISDEYAGFDD